MAVTVVNPNRQAMYADQQQRQASSQNLLSILSTINQRRQEIEKQQREMEYEFINNYAAEHGGFAGLASMPGGDKLLSHYATNIMNYDSGLVPDFIKAVREGYNPDEALYQLHRRSMLMPRQQAQQEQVQPEQQGLGSNMPDLSSITKTVPIYEDRPITSEKPVIGNTAVPVPESTGRNQNITPEQNDIGGLIRMAEDMPTVEGQREIDLRAVGKMFTGQASSYQEGLEQVKQQEELQAEKSTLRDSRVKIGEENVISIPQGQEDAAVKARGDALNSLLRSTRQFRGGVPPWNEMTKTQQEKYKAVETYLNTTTAQTPEEFLTGAKQVFKTVGLEDEWTGTSKDRVAGKQMEQKGVNAIKSFKPLGDIRDYGKLDDETTQQMLRTLENIKQNDPERYYNTFKTALKTNEALAAIDYNKANAALARVGAAIKAVQLKTLEQQGELTPEQMQSQLAMQLVGLFIEHPDLAENKQFKPAAMAASGIITKIFESQLDGGGNLKVSLKQNKLASIPLLGALVKEWSLDWQQAGGQQGAVAPGQVDQATLDAILATLQ